MADDVPIPHTPRHRRRYRVEIVEYLDDDEAARETHAASAAAVEDIRRRLEQTEAA